MFPPWRDLLRYPKHLLYMVTPPEIYLYNPSNQVQQWMLWFKSYKTLVFPLLNAATTRLGVLKRGNSFLSVETEKLRFLDMRN